MMKNTSELCDLYPEEVSVVDPIFSNFGGRHSFCGQIMTVKCFESNGLLHELLSEDGANRVLLIDGGGSVRRALIDTTLAELAIENNWEGIIVYGSVRQVDDLAELNLGIQAISATPVRATSDSIGEIGVGVNFGGVTFYPDDYIYADNTGIILSENDLQVDIDE